jgi:hypothetical protein
MTISLFAVVTSGKGVDCSFGSRPFSHGFCEASHGPVAVS